VKTVLVSSVPLEVLHCYRVKYVDTRLNETALRIMGRCKLLIPQSPREVADVDIERFMDAPFAIGAGANILHQYICGIRFILDNWKSSGKSQARTHNKGPGCPLQLSLLCLDSY
jgi:hypothetical protein